MIAAAESLAPEVGLLSVCEALNLPRSTVYRSRQPHRERAPRPKPKRSLGVAERQTVLETLNSEPYADLAPAQVYNQLLDAEIYLCSIRTMYRILEDNRQVRERRNVLRHPTLPTPRADRHGAQPGLVVGHHQAARAGQVELLPPLRHARHLQPLRGRLASRRFASRPDSPSASSRRRYRKQGVSPGQLTLHADRGTAMTAKAASQLLADLGIAESHSRPQGLQRQPVLGEPVQDPQVPPRVPRPLRRPAACPRRLPRPLRLVQHRTPPLGTRLPHSRGGSLRPRVRRSSHNDSASSTEPTPPLRALRPRHPIVHQLPPAVWINPPEKGAESLIVAQ